MSVEEMDCVTLRGGSQRRGGDRRKKMGHMGLNGTYGTKRTLGSEEEAIHELHRRAQIEGRKWDEWDG